VTTWPRAARHPRPVIARPYRHCPFASLRQPRPHTSLPGPDRAIPPGSARPEVAGNPQRVGSPARWPVMTIGAGPRRQETPHTSLPACWPSASDCVSKQAIPPSSAIPGDRGGTRTGRDHPVKPGDDGRWGNETVRTPPPHPSLPACWPSAATPPHVIARPRPGNPARFGTPQVAGNPRRAESPLPRTAITAGRKHPLPIGGTRVAV